MKLPGGADMERGGGEENPVCAQRNGPLVYLPSPNSFPLSRSQWDLSPGREPSCPYNSAQGASEQLSSSSQQMQPVSRTLVDVPVFPESASCILCNPLRTQYTGFQSHGSHQFTHKWCMFSGTFIVSIKVLLHRRAITWRKFEHEILSLNNITSINSLQYRLTVLNNVFLKWKKSSITLQFT